MTGSSCTILKVGDVRYKKGKAFSQRHAWSWQHLLFTTFHRTLLTCIIKLFARQGYDSHYTHKSDVWIRRQFSISQIGVWKNRTCSRLTWFPRCVHWIGTPTCRRINRQIPFWKIDRNKFRLAGSDIPNRKPYPDKKLCLLCLMASKHFVFLSYQHN